VWLRAKNFQMDRQGYGFGCRLYRGFVGISIVREAWIYAIGFEGISVGGIPIST